MDSKISAKEKFNIWISVTYQSAYKIINQSALNIWKISIHLLVAQNIYQPAPQRRIQCISLGCNSPPVTKIQTWGNSMS